MYSKGELPNGTKVKILAWDGTTGAYGDPTGRTGYVHCDGVFSRPDGQGEYLCLTYAEGMRLEVINKGEETMTNEEVNRPEYIIITRNTEVFKKGGVFKHYSTLYAAVDDDKAFTVKPYGDSYIRLEQADILLQKKVAVEAVKFSPEFVTLEQNKTLQAALTKKPAPKKKTTKKVEKK